MQVVEGWTSLAERVGPLVGLPVASALVVTLLWALTGWSWFDLGPWPWAPFCIIEQQWHWDMEMAIHKQTLCAC